MKNYPEEFNQTYGQVFEEYARQQRNKKRLLQVIIIACTLFISFVTFIVGAWSVKTEEQTTMDIIKMCLQTPLMWIIGVALGVIVSGFSHQLQILKTNIYEEKATEFATTIYYNDLIAALSNAFTLSQEFKDKLKKTMADLYWYDDGFASGIEFDEAFFEEKMMMAGEEYYLARVEDTKIGFLFECKKLLPGGKMETVEFLLPASK